MELGKRIRQGILWFGLAIVASVYAAIWAAGSPPDSPVKDKAKPSDLIVVKDKAKPSDLVVHEWGTFLGMNGSDGTSLDGMYHEEHALPAFVHSRSRDQLRLPEMFLKGETPVIYFYTKERQNVRVGVGFPRGIWTQWYPQASVVRPRSAGAGRAARSPEGRTDLLVRRGDSRVGRQA